MEIEYEKIDDYAGYYGHCIHYYNSRLYYPVLQ